MTTQRTGGRPTAGRSATGNSTHAPPPLPANAVRSGRPSAGGRPPVKSKWPAFQFSRTAWGSAARRCYRVARFTSYAIAPLVLLFMIGFGVLYVRLKQGPIAFDVVVGPIERGINAELANTSVDIQGAELRLGSTGFFEFRLRDLSVIEGDGDVLLAAPEAAVTISSAALWRARVVPERVDLIDAQINLAYTDDDGLVIDRAAAAAAAAALDAPAPPAPTSEPPPAVNLAKMLTDASKRARRRLDATSYLTEFGLKNANVVVHYGDHTSSWRISEASVDFDHAKRRSIISGRAKIDSAFGPWAFSFLTDESEKSDKLQVKATVRDFTPAALGAAAPPFALLKMFQLPIAGDATLQLSLNGDVESADLAVEAGGGRIAHPDLKKPFELTGGLFRLVYDGAARRWALQPSPVKWADGSMLFTGEMRDTAAAPEPPTWAFSIDGKNGVMEAPAFGVAPVSLDAWTVEGSVVPRRGLVDISKFRLAGGGGEALLTATTKAGPNSQSTRAEIKLSAMPLATLKALWPRALGPGARQWVGESVSAATFEGGAISLRTGEFLAQESPADSARGERLSATFQVADATFTPARGMAPVTAPRALISLENDALEVTAPDAALLLPENRNVPLKGVRLFSANVDPDRPDGELTFSTQSPLGPFLEAVEGMPMPAVRDAGPLPKAADGKVDAQFTVKLPLAPDVEPEEVAIEGKARITDGRFGKIAGRFDVQGFTLNLDLTPASLDAKGDLLVNGVPAKIVGQRVLGPLAGDQPPLKITANLDEADRTQLGLDVNQFVRGVSPVEISYQKGDRPEPVIKLRADLTDAELAIEPAAWSKAAGRRASLEADIVNGKAENATEIQNFRVSGDDIAIEGWLGMGADNNVREFYFPTFTLNVVSRLEVQGKLKDKVWDIKARGPTFDGRDLFRSMFQFSGERKAKPAAGTRGADVAVEIANVIGASETSLRGLKLTLSKRGDKLTDLKMRGTLDGGAQLAMELDATGGGRKLLVDSVDAGQTLRLIDFYPNMQGGRLRLEVNLEGKGAAEKTGTLWVDDFKVLGDPVVSELAGSADQSRPAIAGQKRQVTREVFQFDRMRAPFSIGYGQFVLEDSYMKGPLVGASVRGKVDFKTRKINLGGTYIPLQGLNSAFAPIPLLGQLISGAQGDGIFGITFAVQGPLAEPQVIVNPLSMIAPGIFRDMFQMTTSNPQVQARDDKPSKPSSERVRASSTPTEDGGASKSKAAAPSRAAGSGPIDGWSSTTTKPWQAPN